MKHFYSLLIALCLPLLSFAAAGDMRGFASVANDNYQGGIVSLSPTSSKMTLKYGYYGFDDGGELNVAVGGYDAGKAVYAGDGKYLVFTDFASKVAVKLNISDGKIIAGSEVACSHSVVSLTYDYASNMVYGCFKDGSAYFLGKFDPAKSAYTVAKIADCERYVAMAAAVDGTIFAINGSGKLVQMDKESGDAMEIGATGRNIVAGSLNCAAIDWNTGKMYWHTTGNDVDGTMYSINTSNGAATRLYTYGSWRALLAFDFEYTYTAATQMPPSAPTIQNVTFTGANKTGTLTFKAPSTMVDGNKGSGSLTYKLMVDGAVQKTGNTSFGATVSESVSVTVSGNHLFAVTVANEAGESNAAEQTVWVGYDKPLAVTNINGSYADGKITLTWTAPTAGVNGGYFNASELNYKVYRGETLVATVSTTEAVDNVGIPETPIPYIYNIYAVMGDETSDVAQSGIMFAGAYSTPYRQNFDFAIENPDRDERPTLEDYNFVVINGGDPDYTWRWWNHAAQCQTYGKQKADDWLITAPIHLEAGKEYRIRFDALCGGSGANAHELFSVSYGTGATVEAMTNELIATTDVSNNSYQPYGTNFTVAQTGDYNFGIHCTSDIHYHLQIDNLMVRDANDYGVPAAASDLTVTPDRGGALKATIAFTIPSLDAYGDPMEGVDQVKVYREDAVIYRSESGYKAGEKFSYTDEVETAGYYTYTVATVNQKGQSEFASERRYVGVNKPAPVTAVTAHETTSWGEVAMSWNAPTTDVDGNPINQELVSYDIFNTNNICVAENIHATSHTFQAIPEGKTQQYIGFRVVAHTEGGDADAALAGMLPLGAPFGYPYAESFADKTISSTFAVSIGMGNGGFMVLDDDQSTVSVTSQDGDNGFLCIEGTPSIDALNLDVISLHSGKIDVNGGSPALSFYYKCSGLGSTNSINVYVRDWYGSTRTQLNATPITTNISSEWERVQLSLGEWKGKTIIFEIEVHNVTDRYTCIDNIRIEDTFAHDLSVYNFTVPAKARAGESMTAQVRVQNCGGETADDWNVVLKRDGKVVWTQPGIEIESGNLAIVYLYDTPPVIGEEEVSYTAEVVYDKDQELSNNETEEKTVTLVMPEWPAVEFIKGEIVGDDYVIEWQRPVGEASTAVIDSFEDYPAWEKETIGDWKVYDYDGLNTAGSTTVEIPVAGQTAAFYVFEGEAHTGNQCLCAFSSTRGDTEDWLISPVLSGEAQTVTFWECGLNMYFYPETFFEIMYSTTDNQPWSFVPLTGKVQASGEWALREVNLPEGAKYFAIVATQSQMKGGALFIDDISYTPATYSTNDLKGYNVYRDGALLVNVDAETVIYTDRSVANDPGHRYFVTVVYDKGESVPSEKVGFGEDGIYQPSTLNSQLSTLYDLSGRRVRRSTIIPTVIVKKEGRVKMAL